ncbi:MAG TPA: hypothetical protein VFG46_20895 [Chryseolinea sp.]|nr:hypothetical protein [Chryseolinea sp.]
MNGKSTNYIYFFSLIAFAFGLSACATYYQSHFDFNNEFEHGDLGKALETLKKRQSEGDGRTRFLYYVNKGLVLSILGEYEDSNSYFEKAFLFGEDYRINYVAEATSYFSNPNVAAYRGEDHEHLMVLYFKAINYLKMNMPDEALVECRRLNIRLNQLNDRYVSLEKFQRDAFIHTLMGIIYQSGKDYNNAFIAYRNALDVYENEYAKMFGMQVPQQLKIDLLNTAKWTGFQDEFENFKTKFGMDNYIESKQDADLIFFWHNGLGPVKDEWSINFMIHTGDDNTMIFTNPELGLNFPFVVTESKDRADLAKLEVFRVAFPRYRERELYFNSAYLQLDSNKYSLQLGEDINKVAFHSLNQRMLQEFAKGLLRAALKKAAEHSIRKEDDRLGALIGLVNAMTEKADTRNWQTLPHSIFYSRVPLKEGTNPVTFTIQSNNQRNIDYNFTYTAKKGQTLFHTFSSLETMTGPYRYY